jgi:hypothetical protein
VKFAKQFDGTTGDAAKSAGMGELPLVVAAASQVMGAAAFGSSISASSVEEKCKATDKTPVTMVKGIRDFL